MAAGLGFKTFNTGDVLSAADTNGYLMQGVWVFANAAARTSAVTSPQEGNVSFLKDTNSLEIYDGAAWVAYGAGDITGVTAGTGISGGGTAGTITVTNSMATAIDAKGDLIVGTGADTFDRLAVGGTNGHVLTVDSSTSTGLKWAAAAGGSSGLNYVTAATFTTSSAVNVDNCFTSTYTNYLIFFWMTGTSGDNVEVLMRLRASGTDTTANYSAQRLVVANTSVSGDIDNNGTDDWLIALADKDFADKTFARIDINRPQEAAVTNFISHSIGNTTNRFMDFQGGYQNSSTQFDGFSLIPSTGTISGSYVVYGLSKS